MFGILFQICLDIYCFPQFQKTNWLTSDTGSLFFKPQGIYCKRIKREADREGYVLQNRRPQWWVRRQGVWQANQLQSSTIWSKWNPFKFTKIDRVQTLPLLPWLCLHKDNRVSFCSINLWLNSEQNRWWKAIEKEVKAFCTSILGYWFSTKIYFLHFLESL